uniref:Uncharacterized protein n=1 Tax=Steinernema glaseri TaxID=37863 RepID=A0A1I7YVE5_9BILA
MKEMSSLPEVEDIDAEAKAAQVRAINAVFDTEEQKALLLKELSTYSLLATTSLNLLLGFHHMAQRTAHTAMVDAVERDNGTEGPTVQQTKAWLQGKVTRNEPGGRQRSREKDPKDEGDLPAPQGNCREQRLPRRPSPA